MDLLTAKNKIKDIPLAEIIGGYVNLSRKGQLFWGLCPFHQDTHASLIVNETKSLYRCFACNTGGDAIAFVQKFKSIGFIEAIKEILSRFGYSPEDLEIGPSKNRFTDPRKKDAYLLLKKVTEIYQTQSKSQNSQPFWNFIRTRGLSEESVKIFQIGFASTDSPIKKYLFSLKPEIQAKYLPLALELGILRKKDQFKEGQNSLPQQPQPQLRLQTQPHDDFYSYYDTFHNRVMFPIFDTLGRVIGFSGRALSEEQKAKYINSQESFLFHKKNILYGLHLSKNFIREKNLCLIVEGHMDLIALHQNGFKNSVAVMGVALGENSCKKIKELSSRVIMGLDTDTAGMLAMKRMNELFMHNGVVPQYVQFAPHKDPDEYLKSKGQKAFTELLESATPFIDHIFAETLGNEFPQTIEHKLEILQKIFQLLSPMKESLWVSEKLNEFIEKLNLKSAPHLIMGKYRDYLKNLQSKNQKFLPPSPLIVQNNSSAGSLISTDSTQEISQANVQVKGPSLGDKDVETIQSTAISRAERLTLEELIKYPQIILHQNFPLLLDRIPSDGVKRVVVDFKNLFFEVDENEFFSILKEYLLGEKFDLEIREIMSNAFFSSSPTKIEGKTLDKLLRDIIVQLEIEKLIKKRDLLRQKQKECLETQGVDSIIEEIHLFERHIQKLKAQRHNIKEDLLGVLKIN
jgi:DNA primase